MKNAIALLLGAVLLSAGFAQAADKPLIRIGARVFTEQTVLAEITAQYLRAHGFDVRVTGGLGSSLARQAQETGQLDLMWEYTGVSLVSYNHVQRGGHLCQGQGSGRRKGTGLAQAFQVQQHLCIGFA